MRSLLLPLLNGSLETAFNRLLLNDAERLKKAAPLQGKTLQLTITGVLSLYLLFCDHKVVVLQTFEGVADSHLSLSLSAIGLLKDKGLLMQYIRDGSIDLQGDPTLWQAFSELLKAPNVDIEAWLAPYTGDALAHLMVRHSSELARSMQVRGQALGVQLGDYVREEARLAVGPLEFADFSDQVAELHKQSLQLAIRLATLTDNIRHS
ncbi:ubiquinone biosynthesis accessory factor UbiJ [Oceanisphaera sp. W20_SRM_FM3]|uniref:ubiquinone biosynthesis accessory factor UbiJ n=1 Tax=Oceanisphaera sp. W20_SRM_FM3 TaxID=3240267 RepID=UPI003F94FEB4